jgi:hypothetical protein
MDKLEAIKARHSVRKYLKKEIEQEKIDKINAEIDEINKESGLNIQLVTNEDTCFGGIMSYGKFENVSNYIALIGKKSKKLDEVVGYYGERLVILAQQLGLNTCWVALTYSRNNVQADVGLGEKLVCVISLGYGANQGVQHKNRAIEKISNLKQDDPEWFKNGVESALLAPTAINQQKFYIERNENQVEISAGIGFYAKVDLGIVKYHFEVGAGKGNFEWKK